MKEKERESQKENTDSKKTIEHTAGVMADWFKINLPFGARLSDLIEKFKEEAAKKGLNVNIYEYLVRLNDKDLEFDEDGKLKEDPVLTEASVLSLVVKKLTGGN